jgi:hypothetical protein
VENNHHAWSIKYNCRASNDVLNLARNSFMERAYNGVWLVLMSLSSHKEKANCSGAQLKLLSPVLDPTQLLHNYLETAQSARLCAVLVSNVFSAALKQPAIISVLGCKQLNQDGTRSLSKFGNPGNVSMTLTTAWIPPVWRNVEQTWRDFLVNERIQDPAGFHLQTFTVGCVVVAVTIFTYLHHECCWFWSSSIAKVQSKTASPERLLADSRRLRIV